jgi:hypothetical protein
MLATLLLLQTCRMQFGCRQANKRTEEVSVLHWVSIDHNLGAEFN